MVYSDGATYRGGFVNDMREGTGQLLSGDGSLSYDGEWAKGVWSGRGTLRRVSGENEGEWFEGIFRDHHMH